VGVHPGASIKYWKKSDCHTILKLHCVNSKAQKACIYILFLADIFTTTHVCPCSDGPGLDYLFCYLFHSIKFFRHLFKPLLLLLVEAMPIRNLFDPAILIPAGLAVLFVRLPICLLAFRVAVETGPFCAMRNREERSTAGMRQRVSVVVSCSEGLRWPTYHIPHTSEEIFLGPFRFRSHDNTHTFATFSSGLVSSHPLPLHSSTLPCLAW